jgi:hypothetical protein
MNCWALIERRGEQVEAARVAMDEDRVWGMDRKGWPETD